VSLLPKPAQTIPIDWLRLQGQSYDSSRTKSTFHTLLLLSGGTPCKKGKYVDAIKDYERALTLKHYFTDARFGLAMTYLRQHDLVRGKENCERILVIDRRDARAYRCLGRIFMEQNNFIEAAHVLERGITYLPNQKELWYDLGLTYLARGMPARASVAFQNSTPLSLGIRDDVGSRQNRAPRPQTCWLCYSGVAEDNCRFGGS
jgi:tetratricopeptide (TPR) repeat protein